MSLPAHLQNRQRQGLVKALTENFGSTLPAHISIKGNHFTLVDAAGNQRPLQTLHLDCVIVALNENKARMYWGGRDYDPNDTAPPTCFSDNGIGASARAQDPQHTSCQLCPWSKWGSATSRMTGKGIPACQEGIKFAVIMPNDPNEITYLLRVPPNSIRAAADYGKLLAGNDADLSEVVTRITFAANEVGTLEFHGVAYIDEATLRREEQLWGAQQAKLDTIVGKDDQPYEGELKNRQAVPELQQTVPGQLAPMQQPSTFLQPPPPTQAAPAQPQAALAQPRDVAAPHGVQTAPKKAGRPRNAPPPQQQAPAFQPAAAPSQAQPAPFQAAHPVGQGSPEAPIPPFLQRGADNRVPQSNGPGPSFGIQAGAPAPHAELQASLDRVLNLKT